MPKGDDPLTTEGQTALEIFAEGFVFGPLESACRDLWGSRIRSHQTRLLHPSPTPPSRFFSDLGIFRISSPAANFSHCIRQEKVTERILLTQSKLIRIGIDADHSGSTRLLRSFTHLPGVDLRVSHVAQIEAPGLTDKMDLRDDRLRSETSLRR